MKILSIGNSFSEDAQRWLHDFAEAAGEELYTRNLYIGGCPLKLHFENLINNAEAYSYHTNGITAGSPASSIMAALKSEEWDVITIQQVSGSAGRPETYEPYIGVLVNTIRQVCPKARLCFHETWEYEFDCSHAQFEYFENSCDLMYGCIRATVRKYADDYKLDIIPSGDAIHAAKKLPEFDSEHGGVSLYRDHFHVGLTYGRLLLAHVWYAKLTGKSPIGVGFVPEDAAPALCAILEKVAAEVVGIA